MHSAVAGAALNSSTTITTEVIKRICVERGFYRNPICNEKLYLHHKGFDSIDIDAFEPYIDVKVLWLESNALTSIACGKDGQEDTEQLTTVDKPDELKNSHVDCAADWATTFVHDSISVNSLSEEGANIPRGEPTAAICGKEKENVVVRRRDVFRTLYPTLRQLYLHNNALREMPDLSGFQRLDSVNLSGNAIHAVRAHCVAFGERVVHYEETMRAKAKALLANSKSMQREERERTVRVGVHSHIRSQTDFTTSPSIHSCNDEPNPATKDITSDEGCDKNGNKCAALGTTKDMNWNGEEKVLAVEEWRQRIKVFVDFCPHEAIDVTKDGKILDNIPTARLNPCSSIRTLNLASNFITGVGDLVELLCYKLLTTLDLSYNQLHDGEGVLLVVEQLKRLLSLKLCGNPLVRTLPRYRKTVLARCGGLLHLDDRPVMPEERRLVTTWARGGEGEECRERQRIKDEIKEEHIRRLEEFRAMVDRSVALSIGESHRALSSPMPHGPMQTILNGVNNGSEESATSSEQDSDSENGSESRSESESENSRMTNMNNSEEGEVSGEADRRARLEMHTMVVYDNVNDEDDDIVYVP